MLKLLFVGDIAIQGDGKLNISHELKEKMQEYDFRICNFEGATGDIQTCVPRAKAGPLLLQDPSSYSVVKQLGFDLFGLANNHILDFEESCLCETIEKLEKQSSGVIGVQFGVKNAYDPYILEKDGMKVAFFSAAENSFGVLSDYAECGHAHLFSRELLIQIRKYKKICDKIVLLAHAGLENINIPMPELVDAYKNFIDSGVDVVIGHHPHVVQGWESYGNGLIFYSLGNFLWQRRTQNFVNMKTVMVGVHIDDAEISYEIIPVRTENNRLTLNNNDAKYNNDLKEYCAYLKEENRENLIREVDEFCLNLYQGAFKDYIFSTCRCNVVRNAKDYIKSIVRSLLRKHEVDNNFVYHNSAVETNVWVSLRAIRYMKKKKG